MVRPIDRQDTYTLFDGLAYNTSGYFASSIFRLKGKIKGVYNRKNRCYSNQDVMKMTTTYSAMIDICSISLL